MKKIIFTVLVILVFVAPVYAEGLKPISYQAIIITSAASSGGVTSFTAPADSAEAARVVFEGNTARFGCYTAPTADLGAPVFDGDIIYLDSMSEIRKFSFFMKTGGTGVTAYATFYGK